MKDRVFIVLSWIAFAHALIVLAGVLDGMNNSLPIPTSEVGRFYSDYLSTVFAGEEIIAYAVSPVIWLLSYVATGKPRILPWKK